ncbi:MAG TPA: hypothetical protein VL651_13455 [Bacteroidia bacterium]|nr:hypothetical protein [Bacteroidia bacterium]
MKHLFYMALAFFKPTVFGNRLRYVPLTNVVPSYPRRNYRARI